MSVGRILRNVSVILGILTSVCGLNKQPKPKYGTMQDGSISGKKTLILWSVIK